MNNFHGITAENLLRTFPIALQEGVTVPALAVAAADALAARPEEIDRLLIYPAIDRLDEELLDILAYDFKVDWWDGNCTLEEKRRTLKDSWRVHRMLGTRAAVELAISAIFPNVKAEEWFEYGGRPYHFRLRIDVSNIVGDLEKQKRMYKRMNYYKNLRSHNEGIIYTMEPNKPAVLAFGGAMTAIRRMVLPEAPDNYDFQSPLRIGGRMGAIAKLPIPSGE